MEKIEVVSLTKTELQQMIKESTMEALNEVLEQHKKPSEYEDITVDQAAKELSCSTKTIRRRMSDLNIRGYRVGKNTIIQRKDLKKIKQAS
jgi:excisionase family DNA binding protein